MIQVTNEVEIVTRRIRIWNNSTKTGSDGRDADGGDLSASVKRREGLIGAHYPALQPLLYN